MAKGATAGKAQHMAMKPLDGPGFSMRGFRHAGDCSCGGITVYAKIAGKMGVTCAGRDAIKRKAFFTTEDGKNPGTEINEKQYQQAVKAGSGKDSKSGVMETEVVVREELKSCGVILSRGKATRFGSA